ncbi:glycosyltransferase [Desulfobulbus alkaliphilus]|uniref:glycosyltransferase n=1 Tax=Desulfobulbus alkaliphilus TaxID=869814 RepID=UPI00196640E1|nr:glycosyltransferase [Desulfobulbus alkaliphilus]MBM9538340.1 glycosyltransferase [Desulfobulbus alkaliphilus]
MRILVLTKRQYMSQDLLDDRYGRFRELPLALVSIGHEVTGICLSYRPRDEGRRDDVVDNRSVAWHALNAKRLLPWGRQSYWRTIDTIGREFCPDLVWACSDALHAILGVRVAKRLGVPVVVDLYDNLESYPATRIPGVTSAFRRALRHADGITCISRPLARYVLNTTTSKGLIEVIENGVPGGLFRPLDQRESRDALGLPTDCQLIGTAGAISRSRGIETLFQAFAGLSQEYPNIHLALAGPLDKGLLIPRYPRVHYLGMLPSSKVPTFLSALDIAIIANRDSDFGKYCFPQKFYECVACGIPVVAARVGVLEDVLQNSPRHLFAPEDAESLAEAVRGQLKNPTPLPTAVPTWNTLAGKLGVFFEAVQLHSTSRRAGAG